MEGKRKREQSAAARWRESVTVVMGALLEDMNDHRLGTAYYGENTSV